VNLTRPVSFRVVHAGFETLESGVHNPLMSYEVVATRAVLRSAVATYSSVYSAVSDAVQFAVSSHDGGAFAPC
jgi:hypothetical protein